MESGYVFMGKEVFSKDILLKIIRKNKGGAKKDASGHAFPSLHRAAAKSSRLKDFCPEKGKKPLFIEIFTCVTGAD